MDDFYRENILDHYRNPRNSGHLEAPTATAEGVNPLCGDELAVELEISDDVVNDVRFNGRGCAISQAAASMISDVVKGKTVAEVAALGRDDILDHYKNPRNSGHLDEPTVSAEGVNPLCGDELTVELLVRDGVVEDIRYNGRGCAISQAAASMISEAVKGKPVDDVRGVGREDVLDELGIPLTPIRLKCAMLSVGVLKVALSELEGEPVPEEWAGDNEITWKSG